MPILDDFPRRHKILFGVIVFVGVILYAAFNVWVFRLSKSGNAPSPSALWQKMTKSGTGFPGITEQSSPPSRKPTPTPTPTPRPKGPGDYACSPEGVCNLYGEEQRKEFCTQTYADSLCLDECGDKEKQCSK